MQLKNHIYGAERKREKKKKSVSSLLITEPTCSVLFRGRSGGVFKDKALRHHAPIAEAVSPFRGRMACHLRRETGRSCCVESRETNK